MLRRMFGQMWMPMMEEDSGAGGGGTAPEGEGTPASGVESTPNTGGAPEGTGSGAPAEEMITKTAAEAAIRARIAEVKSSMEKQYGDHDRYKGVATKLASMSGKTVEAVEAELAAIEAETISKQTGIPPQVYQKMLETDKELNKLKADNTNAQLDLQEVQLKANPLYADALKNEDTRVAVREFALSKGLTMEQAYWATQGNKSTAQMERDIEHRIMASLQNKAGKGNIINDSGGAPTDETYGLSPQEQAFAKTRGMSNEEAAVLKNSNNIDAYRAHKKAKGK